MENVKDKIAKLLALATSSNENEAKAALLKARKLMAENKLVESDIVKEDEKVVKQLIGVKCSGQTDTWAAELSAIIAKRYCCVAFRQRHVGQRQVVIGFCGLESDFEVCKEAFMHAYNFIKHYCENNISRESDGTHGAYRKRCNAYGWGFTIGLNEAFKGQEEAHKDWGLVMVVPNQVWNEFEQKNPTSYGHSSADYDGYKTKGYTHGKQFNVDAKMVEA